MLILAINSISCTREIFNKKNDGGKIVYDVSIVNKEISPLLLGVVPTSAEFYFRNNKSVLIMASRANIFQYKVIVDHEKMEIVQQLKIFKSKYKAFFDQKQNYYYQEHPGFSILNTNIIDTIAGLKGDVSIVIFDDITSREFRIISTSGIDLANPNWYNTYNQIPGVLLQYQFKQFGLEFKLKAKSIEFSKVDKTLFEPGLDYQEISPDSLINELKELADTF